MTTNGRSFETRIEGTVGVWPEPPTRWSFSTLMEIETCPRRYALRHASFPSVWDGTGYPEPPVLAALSGTVVHQTLETVLRAFNQEGCSQIGHPCAANALRQLGGYTAVIAARIDGLIEALVGNPRVEPRLEAIRTRLTSDLPLLRQKVQALVSRIRLVAPSGQHATGDDCAADGRLVFGSHPEVALESDEVRLVGRVDLITLSGSGCEIIDYKSGRESEHHIDQLRLYELLWSEDRRANPEQMRTVGARVSYPGYDVEVEPLRDDELAALKQEIGKRVMDADRALSKRPPVAIPGDDCVWCPVRHMCDEYWSYVGDGAAATPGFTDLELAVLEQNGPRSWLAAQHPGQVDVLLRTQTESPGFGKGDSLRVLGGRVDSSDDGGSVMVWLTRASEVYKLSSS